MSNVQPPRKTDLIVTEIRNEAHPEKPAVIENEASEVQMTAKVGFLDQKITRRESEENNEEAATAQEASDPE